MSISAYKSFIQVDLPDYVGETLDLLIKVLDVLRPVSAVDLTVDQRHLLTYLRKCEQVPVDQIFERPLHDILTV